MFHLTLFETVQFDCHYRCYVIEYIYNSSQVNNAETIPLAGNTTCKINISLYFLNEDTQPEEVTVSHCIIFVVSVVGCKNVSKSHGLT